jgi:hypothetical protein
MIRWSATLSRLAAWPVAAVLFSSSAARAQGDLGAPPFGEAFEAWLGHAVEYLAILTLGIIVPAAVIIGRAAVRRARRTSLEQLQTAMNGSGMLAAFGSFGIVLARYSDERAACDRLRDYLLPILIFSSVSALGFYGAFVLAGAQPYWSEANFLFAASRGPGFGGDTQLLAEAQWRTAAVMTFAFFGGYVWSINYFIKRIGNYDLSPVSFLRASAQIIFACFTVAALWHLVLGADDWLPAALLLPAAFLIGFHPAVGLDNLVRRIPTLKVKRLHDQAGQVSPSMPLDMLDGVSWFAAYRLGELEIDDVQNLATVNPFEIFASTPYGFYEIMDWVAQAQLMCAVGPERVVALRRLNVRTIFDVHTLRRHPELRKAGLRILLGEEFAGNDDPELFDAVYETLADDPHVDRVAQIWLRVYRRLRADAPDDPGRAVSTPRLAAELLVRRAGSSATDSSTIRSNGEPPLTVVQN